MPKVTVRPVKQEPNYKRLAVTGAGGKASVAVSDQSDATYIRRAKADAAPIARFAVARPTVPAGCDIATVVPGARLRQPTSTPPRLVTLAISIPGPKPKANKLLPTINGPSVRAGSGTSVYTFAQPAGSGRTSGPSGPWAGLLGKLGVRVNDGHKATDANRAYIYEVFADLYCAARPTVALSTEPETPITTTSYPTLVATFSALVEDWQDNSGPAARTEIGYQMRVFGAAQYAAPGFDPAVTRPIWSVEGLSAPLDFIDGETASSEDVEQTPDLPLANGTYRLYARGRRAFEAAQYSAWEYLVFTVGVTPCPPPDLSVALDDAGQRVTLTVTPQTAVGAAAPLLTVQRSEDEGGTWQTLRGLDKAPCAFAEPLTVHDREAARGVALRYRACVEASFDDAQLVSDWRTAAVEAALSVSGWNLKCPLEPERDWLGARIVADPEWTQEEDAGTFRPIGRRLPVVVSMALGGADGSLVISVATEAEWEAAQRLRDYAGTLYLESPYGWARYVRILSRSWVETGAPDGARRRLTCSFLEVEAP